MSFCPKCRAEYRREFDHCKACGGVALVETLPEPVRMDLAPGEVDSALPVGFATGGGRTVEVDGHVLDPSRVFELDSASNLKIALAEQGIASLVVPLSGVEFPDGRPRFELRVRPGDQERAEAFLFSLWQSEAEAQGLMVGSEAADIERCPACGEHVPLDVEECPECGLSVGLGAEREAAEPA